MLGALYLENKGKTEVTIQRGSVISTGLPPIILHKIRALIIEK